MTDQAGRYVLINVPDTVDLELRFEKMGYNSESIDVSPNAMVVRVDASLVGPCAPQLEM
jgi:hypothetical protein